MKEDIHIFGGGITGLFLAYHHVKKGNQVTLYEEKNTLGGVIGTKKEKQGLVELAANGILLTDDIKSMLDEIGLSPVFPKKASKRRYFWTNQKLSQFPISILSGTKLLYSIFLKKLKFDPNLNFEEWGNRMFGSSVTKNIIEPALGGIYGTRLTNLQPESIFSKWDGRGQSTIFKEIKKHKKRTYGTVSFPNGMGDLVTHLVNYLSPKMNIKTGVSLSNVEELQNLTGAVRICTSLKNLLPILEPILKQDTSPNLLTISTITRFGETKLTKKPCFGVLFGKNEGIHALGVLCNSDIFDGRVTNSDNSETWIYPKLAGVENDFQMSSILEKDRALITGKVEEPKAVYKTTWEGVFPAYDKNLYDFNQTLDQLEIEWKSKGLDIQFYGNYRKGIGLRSIFESTMLE
ncbi:protoporphyrinogen oxidase [Leptospira biflexa]|uniref:protoporphyrinogen/coproporphyrinogen oxidase n=1 Tax=Leptospira biflexa TaxID=172 RepID=UPI0010841575|nr:NAD(P)-binding protein [Leptospira biflexa]TGM35052.1 protoporphyrinogen oxidase [Leptospira biflexa]TGM38514.1 protoporphyrinogen oxidase [Leptospira biflexa]TGM48053.1 protoporphyrinogen oxidase [Leptospira biflexa]TGM49482.1 protoporphyrinogen oxidase [Leptospira biflexa]TGM54749.1 protoporphyrinogen oxidase [Leptospira biflexa]